MKEFTRRAFCNPVWAKPITDLAKEFEISDVALHNTCEKIPITTMIFAANSPTAKRSASNT